MKPKGTPQENLETAELLSEISELRRSIRMKLNDLKNEEYEREATIYEALRFYARELERGRLEPAYVRKVIKGLLKK